MQPTIEQVLRADPDVSAFLLARLSAAVAAQRAATTRKERAVRAQQTFALYLDCCDLGLAAEARAIVGRGADEAAGRAVA